MSDTPRTDIVACRFADSETEHPHALAFCNLARQLERELAMEKEQVRVLREASEQMASFNGDAPSGEWFVLRAQDALAATEGK